MRRRAYLMLASGVAVGLAGCSTEPEGQDSEPRTESDPDTPRETEWEKTTTEPPPDPLIFEGVGDEGTDRFSIRGGLNVLFFDHGGSGHYAVWLLDENGEREELFVNDIGPYEGELATNRDTGEYFLNVEANGDWRVEWRQVNPVSTGFSLPAEKEETDSSFIGRGELDIDGAARVVFKGHDQENYAVWLLDRMGRRKELLLNEIGPTDELSQIFSGNGPHFVQVETGGRWVGRVERA